MKKKNIEYKKYTAGRIMTENVPVVNTAQTVGDVEKLITKRISDFDTINYVYVVDSKNKLKGVVSIKELYKQKKRVLVKGIMTKDLVVVHYATNQERVVYEALKHNIKAVPVVGKGGIFLGVVQSDSILNTLHNEARSDMLQLAGVHNPGKEFDNTMKMSVFKSFKHRFPWLFIGLIGGIFIAEIIGFFEKTLSENLIIAAFIPLVVYIASATGTQLGTFIIRDLAINYQLRFLKYLVKQFFVVFFIALMSGVGFFIISIVFYKELLLGLVISVAMFVSVISSLFSGLIVPYTLSRLKFDPANASGPLGTIIQDILTVVIYFAVAAAML